MEMSTPEEIRRELVAAHAEAMRVGDSPLRADQVAARLERVNGLVERSELSDEGKARLLAAIADALRVLRRDDDGREAAKHLQGALRLVENGPRRPSPFPDD
jgi:Asp-tRNA(Asn)/Glu-tRNA(Gln) amidotransferase C subunit